MGHNGIVALDKAYFNPSVQTLFEEFKKHMANLTIDDNERLKVENNQKQERIKELEDEKDKKISELQEKLEDFVVKEIKRNYMFVLGRSLDKDDPLMKKELEKLKKS